MKEPRLVLLRILAIVFGSLACLVAALVWLNSGPGPRTKESRLFAIQKGESLSTISRHLQDQGFIRFAPLLDLLGRARGTASSFKAGYYRLAPGATTFQIHDFLVKGAQAIEKVTIPEGWTVRKIALHLEAEGVCSAADFEAAAASEELSKKLVGARGGLEGYLFPDTYLVPRPFDAEAMVELMVRTFHDHLASIAPEYAQMTPTEVREKLIVASIVEREYRVPSEAPLIASVFYNRLRHGIGLESCATLEYIITEIQRKAHPEYITIEDKRIDSPYNTYKWAGLPPGPISDPGRVALDAAFHPARTAYYYFVLRDENAGSHYFSVDLNEHNQAKYLYLKKP
jgi:UPF0755 protein